MRVRNLKIAALIAMVIILAGCHTRQPKADARRSFPQVAVPTAISDDQHRLDYHLYHFWDAFLDTTKVYTCDSLLVNGVHRMEVTQNAVMYANVVRREGFDKGAAGLANTVTKLEAFQKVAPQSNVFEYVTREICEIFYDANSPYRDEDLYATFAARLLLSPYCPAQMRETFRRDIRLCAMNRVGTPAADFVYVDRSGRRHHLYDIKTEYTLLVFLNPGCEACEQIVEPLAEPVVVNLIKSGRMTLLGMYIDEDIPDWLSKCEKLPELWKDGYDPDGIIRSDLIYHIRAIPSVYLLDRDKTVLLKDAHILFVSTELEKIYSNQ